LSKHAIDTAIVGAGPYALSLAAHLGHRGVDFRIFGRPMQFWRRHMPKGMMLKSDGFASSLSAPQPDSSLADYCGANDLAYHDTHLPVPLSVFTDYALDFQRRFVPSIEDSLGSRSRRFPKGTGFARRPVRPSSRAASPSRSESAIFRIRPRPWRASPPSW
jgi:hypothetical protein